MSKYDAESRKIADTVCEAADHEVICNILDLLYFQRIVAARD